MPSSFCIRGDIIPLQITAQIVPCNLGDDAVCLKQLLSYFKTLSKILFKEKIKWK